MFILDRPKSDKPTYIFLKKTLSDGPFKSSLGLKILPVYWLKDTERAEINGLDKSTADENKSINSLLSKIKNFIEGRERDARYTTNYLTCRELAEKIEQLTGKRQHKHGTDFFEKCNLIVADMVSGEKLNRQGKRYSPLTINTYNSVLKNLGDYNPHLRFSDISMDFYKAFIKWCNEKDFSLNYVGFNISKLISLMKEGHKRGYHKNAAYLDDDFKVITEVNDDISISESELEKIYNHVFEDKKKYLDRYRDWAIVDAYLGLRVSDIQLLEERNIHNDKVTIVHEKTDTKVVVPINSKVKAILKKWNGLPPKVCKRTFQDQVKEVCRLAGLDQPVVYFMTKGGARKDYYVKKHELVSPHTFRRTFITNLLNAGVPDNQVMQLAGIKRHTTLMRYKKTKPEETAEILKGHAFFK